MKTTMTKFLALAATLLLVAPWAHADDTDIFGGGGSGGATPNILILVDNTSSNDAAYASTCPYTGPPANLPNATLLDMVYCAVYGALEAIKTSSNGQLVGRLNVGLMSGGSGSNKGGQMYYPGTAPYNLPLMDLQGITNFENIISSGIPKAVGNAKVDGDMTEVWAWLTGNTGPRSGTSYVPHIGTMSCQRSFLILIGASAFQGRPCNGDGCGSASELAAAGATAAQQVPINSSNLGPYTADDTPGSPQDSWVNEWSRFLYQTDFNNNASDKQSLVTYTIAAGGNALDYKQLLQSTANVGGGKAFVGNDYASMVSAILQIFNEVAAVNSVFASSSLPVSVNAQGTFQNQIYIGMFRPDGSDLPRWLGNLKQYQFGLSGTAPNLNLFLADSTGAAALSASHTGFMSPTAISFWTSKDTTKLPDSIGGFYVNNPQSAGGGYDLPDGELVEKGGVGQQVRLANLQDNYTTNPHSPRNLYTCNGSCANNVALSGSNFSTDNTNITAASFGITGTPPTVSSISRTGNVVTMTLAAAPSPALVNGQNVTVGGSSYAELNGNFPITLVNPTTFTYTIIETPPTPSTGTYTASIPSTPLTITSLTRVGTTVTAITASANTYTTGQNITISGATQAQYNGTFPITVVNSTTFTYTMNDSPAAPSSGGTATVGGGSITFTTSQITRDTTHSDNTSIVTVLIGSSLPGGPPAANSFQGGNSVTVSGVAPAGYNGTFTILYGGGNAQGDNCPGVSSSNKRNAFCYRITTAPVTPATGSPVADATVYVPIAAGGITHTTSCSPTNTTVTVTVTTSATHPFTTGQTVTISGTAGTRESSYLGAFPITRLTSTSFKYTNPISVSPPCSPSASGVTLITGPASIDVNALINWVRGDDNLGDELSPGNGITVRPSVHGDVVHSRPTVIDYGTGTGVVVFYGDNDGVFHAINGNQPLAAGASISGTPPGGELWGFIPTEFFVPLKRQYTNNPMVKFATTPTSGLNPPPSPKDYFFDGATGVYNNLPTAAYIYLSARRGGSLIYALNVTDPANPKFLWKHTSADAGFGELGQTWSAPKVAKIKGHTNSVLIFAAGYDTNQDNDPPTVADTMGRGIFILDAVTGCIVWQAGPSPSTSGLCSDGATKTVSGMTSSIPSDVTLLNRDFDTTGYIDRLYVGDTGGNIWRVDLEPNQGSITPSNFVVTQLASLGGTGSPKRKIFYPPDVVVTSSGYDLVMVSTGDREHPLYSASATSSYAVVNRFYVLKDKKTGYDATGATTIVDNTASNSTSAPSTLSDATTTVYSMATANDGFFMRFTNAGEKGVNAPTTIGGFTYFGSNQPVTPSQTACNNLGTARGYQVNFLTGASASVVFDGGGLPPSPVAGLVNVTPPGGSGPITVPFCLGCGNPSNTCTGPDCTSSLGGGIPTINVSPVRKRVYWYLDKHDS